MANVGVRAKKFHQYAIEGLWQLQIRVERTGAKLIVLFFSQPPPPTASTDLGSRLLSTRHFWPPRFFRRIFFASPPSWGGGGGGKGKTSVVLSCAYLPFRQVWPQPKHFRLRGFDQHSFRWGSRFRSKGQSFNSAEWALSVCFNFFSNKKRFFAFLIKLIWLGVSFLNRTGAEIGY